MAPRRFSITLLLVVVASLVLSACAPAAGPAPAATSAPVAATSAPAAATSAPAAATKPLKIGLVHPSPITDSWSGLAWAALQRAEKEFGAQITNVQVGEPAGFEKAFSDFGAQGYDVVVGHGFQYNDAAAKVAPQFPDTYYIIVNGSSFANNLTGLDTIPGYVQTMYALGMAAGKISRTKQCTAFTLEMPATKLPNQGFIMGFESIPGNKCSLVTLNDQNDVGAAKEAAVQAINAGADILTANANLAGSGVWQALKDNGGSKVFGVGTVGDVNDQAPNNMLVSAAQDVPAAIFNAIKAIKDGTIKRGSGIVFRYENPGDEAAYPLIWNPNIPATVLTPELKAEVASNLKKIATGELKVPEIWK